MEIFSNKNDILNYYLYMGVVFVTCTIEYWGKIQFFHPSVPVRKDLVIAAVVLGLPTWHRATLISMFSVQVHYFPTLTQCLKATLSGRSSET